MTGPKSVASNQAANFSGLANISQDEIHSGRARTEVEDSAEAGATASQDTRDDQARPIVACLRCRNQKLKCDREIPSCTRCSKQKTACRYPSPPNRKRIAQQGSQSRAPRSSNADHTYQSESSPPARRPEKRQRIHADAEGHPIDTSGESGEAELPSTEAGLLLLEVYFKRIYNASLLFHKSIAFHLYTESKIPGYLLRAIFAQAAIFLEQVDSPHERYIKIFPVHTLYKKSWAWARSASQEVLARADEPTLMRTQALQVLQHYYFSQGEIERAIVHASLAYQLSQLLGYDRLREAATSSISRSAQFDLEMRRRCFWACWCSVCTQSELLDSSRAIEKAAGLPLPARFEKGGSVQGVDLHPGQKMKLNWKLSPEGPLNQSLGGSTSNSLMAEVVKLSGMWNKVRAFVSDPSMRLSSQRTDEFRKLSSLFTPLEPVILLFTTDLHRQANIYDESPELLIAVCTVYRLLELLLHASMIPILSGCAAESPSSKELVRESAEYVLQQATHIALLLQNCVDHNLDMTKLWPLSGYGAFVSATVFLIYSNIERSTTYLDQPMDIPELDSAEMNTTRIVLEVLSQYWKPLRRLVKTLDSGIDFSQTDRTDLVVPPVYTCNISDPSSPLKDPSAAASVSYNLSSFDDHLMKVSRRDIFDEMWRITTPSIDV
ncbi:MAG: hypothetical protein M1820_007719 [Bogoriella megaspora]|nr:MAG: hypothetical protein M1820_007719 [Bogoriella megaspora]